MFCLFLTLCVRVCASISIDFYEYIFLNAFQDISSGDSEKEMNERGCGACHACCNDYKNEMEKKLLKTQVTAVSFRYRCKHSSIPKFLLIK